MISLLSKRNPKITFVLGINLKIEIFTNHFDFSEIDGDGIHCRKRPLMK